MYIYIYIYTHTYTYNNNNNNNNNNNDNNNNNGTSDTPLLSREPRTWKRDSTHHAGSDFEAETAQIRDNT